MCLQQTVEIIGGREVVGKVIGLLMGQGHGTKGFMLIEVTQRETSHFGMHAPMTVEDAHKLGASLAVLPAQQAFKKGVATVF